MTLSVFQSTVVNENGDIQPGAEVSVINEATGLPATIYSTLGGAALTNPMFADGDGFAQFYADAGLYRITATSGAFSRVWRYVRLGDASSRDIGTASGQIPTNDDLPTIARNGNYLTYGGAADAITLTSGSTLSESTLMIGDKLRFKATTTNTGSTTIAVDGGSTIACKTPAGVDLPAGFIRTDVTTECEYDGTNFIVYRKHEQPIGEGQTWQNMLASRAADTVYTNNTGRSIMVSAVALAADQGTARVQLLVDGVTVSLNAVQYTSSGLNAYATASGLVPSGATYQIVSVLGTLYNWSELR